MTRAQISARGRLDRLRIVAAALAVGDAQGPRAVSMRSVAAFVGCDPMALYAYVRNKDDLLDAAADAALEGLEIPQGGTWLDRLRGTAAALRSILLAHPLAAQRFAVRPPLGPHGLRVAAAVLATLDDGGLSRPVAVRVFQTLLSFTVGAVAQSAGSPQAGQSRTAEVRRALVSSAAEGDPGLAAAAPYLVDRTSEEAFLGGVDIILTGVEEIARSGERAADQP